MSLYKKRHLVLVGFMSGLLIFALLLSTIVGGTSALDMNSRFNRYVEDRLGAYMCFCGKCSCKPSSVQTEQAV